MSLTLGQEFNPNDIKEDTDVYFHCTVNSNPPAYKIIWKHNVSTCLQSNHRSRYKSTGTFRCHYFVESIALAESGMR